MAISLERIIVRAAMGQGRWVIWHSRRTLSLLPKDRPDPRIFRPLPLPSPEPVAVDPEAETAIVLHLHYPDLWSEFHWALQMVPRPFRLVATVTDPALAPEIEAAFPGAAVIPVEKRGRDMGPFFEVLHAGHLDGTARLLKIHGDKTATLPPEIGDMWRRSAILALLHVPPIEGILGPGHLLFPNDRVPPKHAGVEMLPELRRLTTRFGVPNPALEFFGGSMFWLSGRVLPTLRRLGLRQSDFDPERAHSEQSLAHVCERVFCPATRAAGLPVQSVTPDFLIIHPSALSRSVGESTSLREMNS